MADATYVDDHGAVGDGITIDSAAVQAATVAAGVGGTIRFTSGKTYIVDMLVFLFPYQKIDYNGATIKRAPQAKTTLTAAFSDTGGGSVVLTVADTSDFRVGSYISITLAALRQRTVAEAAEHGAGQVTLTENAENPYGADIVWHRIESKTATTLTVVGGFLSTLFSTRCGVTEYPIGSEVVSAYPIWRIPSDTPGIEIFGGIHDGGSPDHSFGASGSTANGWQVRGRRWEVDIEIYGFGPSSYIHDMEFVDCPGDVILAGGRGTVVERCIGTNIGGNFTHTSAGDDVRIDKCHVYGANRVWLEHDGLSGSSSPRRGSVGHENGAYAWSQFCERVHLTNSYAEDAMCLFSPIFNPVDDEATISLCTGRNLAFGFFLWDPGAFQGADVIIDRCRFYDSGRVYIGRAAAAPFTESQVRTTMLDCELVNTKLLLQHAQGFTMEGGRIRHDNPGSAGDAVVTVTGGSNIEIRTHIDGADAGLYASGTVDGLTISSKWSRIHTYAISLTDLDAASRRIRVNRNEARFGAYLATDDATATTPPAASVSFLRAGSGGTGAAITAENNYIRMETAGIAFYLVGGEVKIRDNMVETNPATATRPVRFYAGTAAAFVDNWISYDPKDDPGRSAVAGAAVSQAGGTPGNGTVNSLTADALALTGVYNIVVHSASTNAGRYMVFRPDGVLDGMGAIPGAYNGMINFTLADGSIDFVIGDRIPVTVTGNAIERNRTMAYAA